MYRHCLAAALALSLAGCQSPPPMETVDAVDLERYMGEWYVIASIPTWIERDAYAAREVYTLAEDGTIDTVFTFRDGGFDGEERRYTATGFVHSDDHAEWRMQFLWPFRAEFLIIALDDDYEHTVIGRTRRDYVWIMAREPEMDDATYRELVELIDARGYDTDALRRVPQEPESGRGAAR